jgi:hypothetical protein
LEWKAQDLQKQEGVFALPQKRIHYKLYAKTEAAIKQYHHEDTICKTLIMSSMEDVYSLK